MKYLRMFVLLYIIVVAGIYYIYFKSGRSGPLLPGDYYRIKGGREIYIPFLSAFIVTIVIVFLFNLIF